jgi:hypothetical protein
LYTVCTGSKRARHWARRRSTDTSSRPRNTNQCRANNLLALTRARAALRQPSLYGGEMQNCRRPSRPCWYEYLRDSSAYPAARPLSRAHVDVHRARLIKL